MSLTPLTTNALSAAHTSGDVSVHPSAAVAPGVLLQAEPGSQIVIAAGVCIGMGSILHAYQGKIEVQESANLGAGVLIVGQANVGALACIGSSTTIFNTSVSSGQMISPGSLIGDTSRQADVEAGGEKNGSVSATTSNVKTSSEEEPSAPWASVRTTRVTEVSTFHTPAPSPPTPTSQSTTDNGSDPQLEEPEHSEEGNLSNPASVYGKAYINHLLVTLLPHRQALEQPLPEESPPTDGS